VPLQHAKITFVTPLADRPGAPTEINVKFNPSEYSLVRNMNYAETPIPGLANPVIQFVRGETQTLSLELYLDGSDRVPDIAGTTAATAAATSTSAGGSTSPTAVYRGIEADLALLRLMVMIDASLHAPPIVEFAWGNLAFRGVVANYTEKFQMLDENGYALRARVTLSLKRYEPPLLQSRALSRQSPDRTKTRVVREGERLDAIAVDEYGDAGRWPVIAAANKLARPRVLVPGTVLLIPPL
jgi:nucleoid-associated protein YgaU